MSLANLLNVPESEQGWQYFSFSNADQHKQIFAALLAKGTRTQDYLLDPIPMADMGVWARQHQQSHDEFAQLLGLQNADLSTVNFEDRSQIGSWIRLHFSLHQQANAKLGIS